MRWPIGSSPAAKVLVQQHLIDDRDAADADHVVPRERAAANELQLQRREVPLADQLEQRELFFRLRLADDLRLGPDAAVRRQRRRLGRRDDARQRLEPRQERLEEPLLRLRRVVDPARERQPRAENVLRVEPEIGSLELDEAAHQQPRARQEHERQRHLQDNESTAQLAATESPTDALARRPERLHHVALRGLNRRRETEEQRRAHRNGHAERERRQVQRDLRLAGDESLRNQQDERLHARVRDETPKDGPERGEHPALDQELPDDAQTARAEREPDRHLALPRRAARQQHVRHVAARDQQQQPHRRRERIQRRLESPDDAVGPADDLDDELPGIAVRILLGQPARDDVELRLRLRKRHARLQLRLEHEEPAIDLRIAAVQHDRPVQIRRELEEPLRRHADARRLHVVEHERPADDGRVHVVAVDPQLVGHDEHRRRARLRIVHHEPAPEVHRHAEEREVVRRHGGADELLGSLVGRLQHVLRRSANHVLEDRGLLLKIEEFRGLEERPAARPGVGRVPNLDRDDPVRILIRKGVQQDVLDDAEDGRRRPDAQGERDDRQGREAALTDESPQAVADVLPHRLHGGLDGGTRTMLVHSVH